MMRYTVPLFLFMDCAFDVKLKNVFASLDSTGFLLCCFLKVLYISLKYMNYLSYSYARSEL